MTGSPKGRTRASPSAARATRSKRAKASASFEVTGVGERNEISACTPCAFATCSTHSRMRRCTSSPTSSRKCRVVPRRRAVSGITLKAMPAWNAVTLTTAASSGRTLRDTIDCNACTMALPATTGSRARCGTAACPPAPRSTISNASADASMGPGRDDTVPSGWSGHPCSP